MKKIIALTAIVFLTLGAGCSSAPTSSTTQPSNSSKTNSGTVAPAADHDMNIMDKKDETLDMNTNKKISDIPAAPTKVDITPTSSSTSTIIKDSSPIVIGPKTYTMADVAAANTPAKCWTAINGKVYDVTAWEKKHPGGEPAILKLCGIDGSNLFNKQHGGQPQPEQALAGFQIGVLK
jgi:cytochrome b involved in lipid metabolism